MKTYSNVKSTIVIYLCLKMHMHFHIICISYFFPAALNHRIGLDFLPPEVLLNKYCGYKIQMQFLNRQRYVCCFIIFIAVLVNANTNIHLPTCVILNCAPFCSVSG